MEFNVDMASPRQTAHRPPTASITDNAEQEATRVNSYEIPTGLPIYYLDPNSGQLYPLQPYDTSSESLLQKNPAYQGVDTRGQPVTFPFLSPIHTYTSLGRKGRDASTIQYEKHPHSPGVRDGWPKWRWPGMQVCFGIMAMLLGYDVSNVANIQASIYYEFGHVELLTWVAIGYTAANACMIPLCRRLYVFGDVRIHFYIYTVVFLIGAAVAGSAISIEAVIVGRVITGIGGAGLYQGVMLYNFSFSTPLEAPKYQALVGVFFAIGLLLGGAFAENSHTTWRWAMYINMPVLAVVLVGWIVFLPPFSLTKVNGPFPKFRRIDFLGWTLHCTSFILLCSVLIYSGSTWPWSSASAIVAWIATGLVLTLYVAQQGFCWGTTPEHRIFPVHLFRDRTAALLGVAVAMAAAAYGISLYYTPLFFAFTHGARPVEAAVDLLPFIGTFVATTMLANVLLPRIRVYAVLYVVGGALIVLAAALQSTVRIDDAKSLVLGKLAVVGAGLGLVFQTGGGVFKALAWGDAALESDCITFFTTMQMGGVALFTSLGGCVFQNLGFEYVRDAIVRFYEVKGAVPDIPDDMVRRAVAGLSSGAGVTAEIREGIVEAITEVIGRMYFMVVATGAVILVCGCAMKWERLEFGPEEGKGVRGRQDGDAV